MDVNTKISGSVMKIIIGAAVISMLAGCANMPQERFIPVDDGETPLARFIPEEHGDTAKVSIGLLGASMICQKGNAGNVNPAAFYKVKANEPTYILGSRVLPNGLYCVSDILTSFTKNQQYSIRTKALKPRNNSSKYRCHTTIAKGEESGYYNYMRDNGFAADCEKIKNGSLNAEALKRLISADQLVKKAKAQKIAFAERKEQTRKLESEKE